MVGSADEPVAQLLMNKKTKKKRPPNANNLPSKHVQELKIKIAFVSARAAPWGGGRRSLGPGGGATALNNLLLVLRDSEAPEAARQLVAVKDGGVDERGGRALGGRALGGARYQWAMLQRVLAVLGERLGQLAGGGFRVRTRRMVDVS